MDGGSVMITNRPIRREPPPAVRLNSVSRSLRSSVSLPSGSSPSVPSAAGEGQIDDVEIPSMPPPSERRERPNFAAGRERSKFAGDRERPSFGGKPQRPGFAGRERPNFRAPGADRPPFAQQSANDDAQAPRGAAPFERGNREWIPNRPPHKGRQARQPDWEVARIFIGAGRIAGIRPGDLVGAIANEAGIDASSIGAIQIADRFALVEVPAEIAGDVIQALRGTTLKGKRVTVRRDLMQG